MSKLLMCVALVLTALVGSPASHARNIGNEGCTPGYWKNHTDNWQEAAPGDLFGSLYASATANVAGLTLEAALSGGGGAGVDGAARILARAATAAWLNAAHEGVGYPWRRGPSTDSTRPPLVRTVNDAFASGDRRVMLALASRLDRDNNLGCPLS